MSTPTVERILLAPTDIVDTNVNYHCLQDFGSSEDYGSNHIKENISKANKGIGILRKLDNVLPRNSLITIYKSFIRPHLDYGAIIFDQPEKFL